MIASCFHQRGSEVKENKNKKQQQYFRTNHQSTLSKFQLKIKWKQIKKKMKQWKNQCQEVVSLTCIEDGKLTNCGKQLRNKLSVGKWNLVAGYCTKLIYAKFVVLTNIQFNLCCIGQMIFNRLIVITSTRFLSCKFTMLSSTLVFCFFLFRCLFQINKFMLCLKV